MPRRLARGLTISTEHGVSDDRAGRFAADRGRAPEDHVGRRADDRVDAVPQGIAQHDDARPEAAQSGRGEVRRHCIQVRTIPAREDLVEATARGERPNLQAEATARVAKGDVLVVAMAGETRTAFMGDIMTTHFPAKGVAAAVLDGGVSDAAAIARIPFPVFGCGAAGTPVTSHRMVVELQTAVGCAGVAVFPGDAIFGDANGVVCIPRHLVVEVADIAEERERMEEWIIERVREGRALAGTYPPNEATMAEYRAWKAARAAENTEGRRGMIVNSRPAEPSVREVDVQSLRRGGVLA